MKALIVSGNRPTKQGTRSPIELFWTAKNSIYVSTYNHIAIYFQNDPNQTKSVMCHDNRKNNNKEKEKEDGNCCSSELLFLKVSVPQCPIVGRGKEEIVMRGGTAQGLGQAPRKDWKGGIVMRGGRGQGAGQGKTGKGEEHLFRGPRFPPTHTPVKERPAEKASKHLHF